MDATDVDLTIKKDLMSGKLRKYCSKKMTIKKLNFQKHNFRALNYRNRNSTHIPIEATFIYKKWSNNQQSLKTQKYVGSSSNITIK